MRLRLMLRSGSALLALLLAGCVAYRPAHLAGSPNLKASVAGLRMPGAHLSPLPALAPHAIKPNAPLDATDVAILAVINDPALKARHAGRAVAAAQLFAAGLLPDPQLDLMRAQPTGGGATVSGYTAGLGEALVPLVTRGDRIHAAQAHLKQVDLQLLWNGWQVAQRARWLVAEIAAERRLHTVERRAAKTLRGARTALRVFAVSNDASVSEMVRVRALADGLAADKSMTERRLNDAQHGLRALLGLTPTARLRLRSSSVPKIATATVARAVKRLPRRRPDLLALAAGFRSRDQKLRAAIAAQFPAISIGFRQDRDIEGATSLGFGLTLRLPLFDGNRGAIRKAEASRAALKAEYQARLDQAVSAVSRLAGDYRILRHEVAALRSHKTSACSDWGRVRQLASNGAADRMETLQLALQCYRARRREITAGLALRKTAIALETLLGVPPARLTRSS